MRMPAIAVHHLARSFGARTVLRDVGVEVPRGGILCLVGANGSGKTTLLEILATLLVPTSGQALVHGLDVARDSAAVRRLVGYGLSNLHSFYPQLTARQNLEFFAAVHGLDARAGGQRINQLIEALGLRETAAVRVQQLSDGLKGRLSVARALLADPPVLLLDEPTKSLDEAARAAVRELTTSDTARGEPRTVVWTTHDRGEAFAIADCVTQLHNGELHQLTTQVPLERAVPA